MSATCNFKIPTKQCTLATCCLMQGVVHYRPSLGGNALYAGVFGALLAAQIVQVSFLYRNTWKFFLGIAMCLLLEVIGYIGRIMIYNNPFNLNNFIIYLVPLTIGPAFMMASIYMCTSRVVVAIGAQHSYLKPRLYAVICIAGDMVSLVLQAVGGAMAATSVKSGNNSANGTHIMIGGLVFQLVSTAVFTGLCVDFTLRARRNPHDRNPAFADLVGTRRFRAFIAALILATLTIFIRSVFRVAELWNGFASALANDEVTFMIFEGPMLIIAGLSLTVLHPGFAFAGRYGAAHWKAAQAIGDSTVHAVNHPAVAASADGLLSPPQQKTRQYSRVSNGSGSSGNSATELHYYPSSKAMPLTPQQQQQQPYGSNRPAYDPRQVYQNNSRV